MDYLGKLYQTVTSGEALKLLLLPIVGAVAARLWEKFKNRTIDLKYSVTQNSFARSSGDLFGGKLQVLFRGKEMKGMFITNATLQNDSNTDIENLTIFFEYRNGEQFYGGSGKISDSPKNFNFTTEFREKADKLLKLGEEGEKSPDFQTLMRMREFVVPVLNRGCNAEFSFLTHSENPPMLYVMCHHKGVKLSEKNVDKAMGYTILQSIVIGLILSVIILFLIKPLFSSLAWAMVAAYCLAILSSGIGLAAVSLWKLLKKAVG